MFGLENKKSNRFEFDLEKQVKKNKKEKTIILDKIATKIGQLKSALREGGDSENIDQYGTILQAYIALERVVKRITKK